jgi:hypothetical protein
VAFSACVVPRAKEEFAGVIANDTSAGVPTVSVAKPLIVPEAAAIVALPLLTPEANPELVMLAIVRADELQFAEVVRSWVLPSL